MAITSEPPFNEQILKRNGSLNHTWYRYFADLSRSKNVFRTDGGRVQKITRVTSTYTLLATDHIIFANTDAGDVTINYPAGLQGTEYKVVNTGTSGNQVFCTPNGTENLLGANSAFILDDKESLIVNYESTDGWF